MLADRHDEPFHDRTIASPLPGVPDAAWTKFVQTMAAQPFGFVADKGFFGAFGFGVRRLVDLKIMKDPMKIEGNWSGTWIVPQEKFMGSPTMQCQALAKSMDAYRIVIEKKYPRAVGSLIDGNRATLSGVLAAAHLCGSVGLGKWLANPQFRQTFAHVTAGFSRANSIF